MDNSSGSSNRLPAWILMLLAAVGVPSTIYLAFITQHPWQVVGLFLLYELTIGLLGVWQQEFQKEFVKAIADLIRNVFYFPARWKYQKDYCNHFHKVYGSVEVRWLSSLRSEQQLTLKLEQIFVEPTIEPKSASESCSNKMQYYLDPERYPKPLMLLGEVGIGKSTLLHYLALVLLDRNKRMEWKIPYTLPFYLSLGLDAFIARLKENGKLSLAEALEVAMEEKGWRQAPPGWIKHRLKKGSCLILLDGLDEVADSNIHQQVVSWIQHQIDTDNKNRFVITSRPLSYRDNPLERVSLLQIQRLTFEQINNFIDKWYQATKGGSARAEELKRRLHENSYKLRKLVSSPLLLRMAIIVHQYRGMLPQSRIALYKDIFEVYLGERVYSGGRWRWKEPPAVNEVLSAKERQKILQVLAYKMTERKITRIEAIEADELIKAHFENMPITPERFLQSVRHNGILVASAEPYYEFAHRSFQEYLAAMYVTDIRQPKLLVSNIDLINLNWWREIIVLYCAQSDPTPIMETCLKEEGLSEYALDLALTLYLEPEIQKNVAQQAKGKPEVLGAWKQFDQAVSSAAEAKDIGLRHKVAGALLTRRKQNLIPDNEVLEAEPILDSSLITCAEYQLFIDELSSNTFQPDHWQNNNFPRDLGLKPILGVRPSDADAFCKWLTAQETGDRHYRLPTSKEAQNILVEGTGGGYWVKDDNEYKFIWVMRRPFSSRALSRSQLSDLSNQENDLVLKSSFELEESADVDYISLVREFIDVRSRHSMLVKRLASIGDQIHMSERILQEKYRSADKRKKELDSEIHQVKMQKGEADHTIKSIGHLRSKYAQTDNKLNRFKKRLDDVDINEKKLIEEKTTLKNERTKLLKGDFQRRESKKLSQRQLANGHGSQQASQLQEQRAIIDQGIQEKQANLNKLKQQQKQWEEELENVKTEKSDLAKQLANAEKEEMSAKQQLESAKLREKGLAAPLEDARKALDEAKQQFSFCSTLVKKFDTIYSDFSRFTPAHNTDISANEQIINLDNILVPTENKRALDDACENNKRYIQKLHQDLNSFYRESNITFANINSDMDEAVTIALEIAHQFNRITSSEYVQKLDNLLCLRLSSLNQNRFSVRSDWRGRLHIRFLAKALAEHLSYWSRKEIVSYTDLFSVIQSVTRHYINIYRNFTILEERIHGNLDASEGILLISEQTRESHEIQRNYT